MMLSLVVPKSSPLDQDPSRCIQPRDKLYSLPNLVKDIKSYLGNDSGIDSSSIDEEYLKSLLRKYSSNPNDWFRYFYNDYSKNYTRNTIENINRKANILLLVWNPGKGSPIHDHANAHCIMKVLAGELAETVYENPDQKSANTKPLVVKSESRHQTNDVTYISDDIGLHRVHNPSPDQIAVSLHLYTPPNAADYGYHIFDATTGKASFVPQARSFLAPGEK
ncbi:cysteine dioxygenase [Talaromyces islandicus]|uniref:Cysteine dioxygenase n=1 Tax=Talaromyces islandicus TaxID=28573 RepID=A0A0U1LMF4_TALIS|nr:cysteine dioxygenase [Talaromyces islandicus]